MSYTKDMVLEVNYGQAKEKSKKGKLTKILDSMSRHRTMTTIISITLMLILIDLMLVASFMQVLSLLS